MKTKNKIKGKTENKNKRERKIKTKSIIHNSNSLLFRAEDRDYYQAFSYTYYWSTCHYWPAWMRGLFIGNLTASWQQRITN